MTFHQCWTDRAVLDRVVWIRWHESGQNDLHGELATNTFLSAPLPFDKHFFFLPFFSFFFFSADYKTVASLARHPPPLCGNNTMEMQCIFHAGKSRTAGTKPDIGQSCNETRHCLPLKTKARSVAPVSGLLKVSEHPEHLSKIALLLREIEQIAFVYSANFRDQRKRNSFVSSSFAKFGGNLNTRRAIDYLDFLY